MRHTIALAVAMAACGLSFDAAALPGGETALTCGRVSEVILLAEDHATVKGRSLPFQDVYRGAEGWHHAKYGNGRGAALISMHPQLDVIILSQHDGKAWQKRGTCQPGKRMS